jgi:hypothetical protein
MFHEVRRTIGGTEVREGALITQAVTSQMILGATIKAGARCDGLSPEAWTAIIEAGSEVVWQSTSRFETFDAADAAARSHARSRLAQGLRTLFS